MSDIAKYVLSRGLAVLLALLATSSPALAAVSVAALERFSVRRSPPGP